MNGKFITFEGPEGSGKTSVIKFVTAYLESKNIKVITTREPGGINISEQIRDIILDINNTEMDPKTEALLYAASRRQHIVEKIVPALQNGAVVICDRFLDSSLAYQGFARNIGYENILKINEFAIDGVMPDLTVFIDVTPDVGLHRVFSNARTVDRLDLEDLTFHELVYNGYKDLVLKFPDRIKVVDGNKSLEEVVEDCKKLIDSVI